MRPSVPGSSPTTSHPPHEGRAAASHGPDTSKYARLLDDNNHSVHVETCTAEIYVYVYGFCFVVYVMSCRLDISS